MYKCTIYSLLIILALNSTLKSEESLSVGFWNAENLFDLEDDPNKNDNEFAIGGKKNVDQEIYDLKIVRDIKTKKYKSKRYTNILQNSYLIKKITKNKFNKKFLGVSINSKSTKKENLFIAIKGKNNDGHQFIKEAICRGASNCVISKNTNKIPKSKVIKVSNTYNFLKKLAILKRSHTNSKIIAVTGSSGKTTVKDLI